MDMSANAASTSAVCAEIRRVNDYSWCLLDTRFQQGSKASVATHEVLNESSTVDSAANDR